MKLLPDCREVSRLLSEAQDRPLPLADRTRLRLHLAMCHSCRNVEAQFETLRQALRALGQRDEPPR